MNKGERSTKNKAMAAYLREKKVARDSGKCPICYGTVKNRDMESHIGMHARSGN